MKLIRENAITDLRKELQGVDLKGLEDNKAIDYYPTKYTYGSSKRYRGEPVYSEQSRKERLVRWVENALRNELDFNTQDLNLVRIAKPKGPTVAKRSPNMLIGISTVSGDAVVVGNDQFYAYFSGPMGKGHRRYDDKRAPEDPEPTWDNKYKQASLRDTWEDLDLWFEIVKQDDYTPRSEINRDRARRNDPIGTYKKFVGDKHFADKVDGNNDMRRPIFKSEADLYDPDSARRKYARRLNQVKERRKYEDILNSIDSINDRIRSIDFGHPILGGGAQYNEEAVRRLKNAYKDFKYEIEHLNKEIENSSDWGMQYHGKYARQAIENINSILADDFGV